VALVLAKGLAYAISLAVGFRGGPIFPAVSIGVMVGVLASIALPDFALAPGVVAGLAGGAAASLKLPFFGALLAALLVGLTATGTAPIAVIAGVTGWLVALRLDLRDG
jgi:chloride channel protein, CIC family